MPDQADTAGSIQTILRYAVKSMGPEQLAESVVTEHGLLGDRGYALIDKENGNVGSAKMPTKWGGLLALNSTFTAPPKAGQPLPPVQINWPDGSSTTSDAADVDARLSATVGREATLSSTKPEEIHLERLDPMVEEEVILDIGHIMMEGRFSDYAAIHMLTTASLARLEELRPDIKFEAGRFRPNLIIAAEEGAHGFVENDWVGKTVCIGDDVRLKISDPTPRCFIPMLPQHGGIAADPKVLPAIVDLNVLPVPLLDDKILPCVGVYGFVEQGGNIKKGDKVRVE
ncbi:MAG: MOSC domain-containing protein [Rhodospirillaceae bacterium]|nr:MOSC domain-containing protein [Rhodospirillaceae bacterium]MBT3927134.1 MOSC domain-containing protein [Rhodospirillaceae bacterium]MBT5038879.1 MOSC domain-containing protein [Rhodospirillaceae bacterium]MBT5779416.1 MOSC domain-containing protein [Rhodospirillaceae bacterium]MBT7291202.1 MOSC domain-containing protein [Rhodospirillaceae bacterium]